jgi:hypothetical protein
MLGSISKPRSKIKGIELRYLFIMARQSYLLILYNTKNIEPLKEIACLNGNY